MMSAMPIGAGWLQPKFPGPYAGAFESSREWRAMARLASQAFNAAVAFTTER